MGRSKDKPETNTSASEPRRPSLLRRLHDDDVFRYEWLRQAKLDDLREREVRALEGIAKGKAGRDSQRRRRGGKAPTARELDRLKRIRVVVDRGAKGKMYCRELENEGIRPRQRWIDEGCPATYPAAYKDEKWRARLQDEKYKVSRRPDLI